MNPEAVESRNLPAEELLPVVYGEWRRLASSRMARQAQGQTLQATTLVHEAWIRPGDGRFENRAHFTFPENT